MLEVMVVTAAKVDTEDKAVDHGEPEAGVVTQVDLDKMAAVAGAMVAVMVEAMA